MKLSEKLAALEEAERRETESSAPAQQMPGQTPRKTTGATTASGKAKKKATPPRAILLKRC